MINYMLENRAVPEIIADKAKLIAIKERLGAPEVFEIKADSMIDAHRILGEKVGEQARKILGVKLDEMKLNQFGGAIIFSRQIRRLLEAKIKDTSIDKAIRDGLEEYLSCLDAWGKAAELKQELKERKFLANVSAEGKFVSSEDLALFLQNDNNGCQTVLYRDQGGSVILWHTEEDDEEGRVEKARMVDMQIKDGAEMQAFVFPDLLPGSGFGKNKQYLQATDFLFLKGENRPAVLANVVAWLALRLGNKIPPEDIIKALGPYVDGYALNTVRIENGRVIGKKIEFMHEEMQVTDLASEAGAYLAQVNVLSSEDAALRERHEEIPPEEDRDVYERRIKRVDRTIHLIRHLADRTKMFENLWRTFSFRVGGNEFANAGIYGKAQWLAKLTKDGQIVERFASGPGIKDEKFIELKNQ